MKLKSLLLGSAAALMTVSGANAADAVFAAEPEPMEYVKVCDTYGNGFFYIPGTETCLSINGHARVEFIHNKASNDDYAVGLRAQKAYEAANDAVTETVLARRAVDNAFDDAVAAGAGAARLAVLGERVLVLENQVNQAFMSRANSVADVNYIAAADQPSNAIRSNAINRLDSEPATSTAAQIAAFTTARNAARINAARNVLEKTSDYSSWVYRARVNIDARNETDWGTLRSQIRLQGDGNTTDGNVSIDRALISLSGLRVGYSDSFFATHHGYGWKGAANDGYFGHHQAMLLDYTFAANGFSATIGVQERSSAGVALSDADKFDSYIGAAYSSGFGRLAGSIIYDASASEVAWKISADITAIENLNIHGWYMADNGGTQYVTAGLGDLVEILPILGVATPEYQWGVDLNYQINTTLNVWAGYTDADLPDAGRFGVGAIWNPVSGFSIRPEAVFGDDYTQVRLRVVRSF